MLEDGSCATNQAVVIAPGGWIITRGAEIITNCGHSDLMPRLTVAKAYLDSAKTGVGVI